MAGYLYDAAIEHVNRQPRDGRDPLEQLWVDADIWAMVVRSEYRPDQSFHLRAAEVAPFEIAESDSYAAGGMAVGGRRVAKPGGGPILLHADGSLHWTRVDSELRYAVFYVRSGDAADMLVAYVDFGPQRITGSLTIDTGGDDDPLFIVERRLAADEPEPVDLEALAAALL